MLSLAHGDDTSLNWIFIEVLHIRNRPIIICVHIPVRDTVDFHAPPHIVVGSPPQGMSHKLSLKRKAGLGVCGEQVVCDALYTK